MTIPSKIIKFLKDKKIKYEIINHKTVYTAYDKAATLKVKPNSIGKTLVIKTDSDLAVVLILGNKNLDKNKFKKIVNDWRKKQNMIPAKRGPGTFPEGKSLKSVKKIDFISERVMKNKFKGIKIGAIPPFGDFWPARPRVRSQAKSGGKLPTFVDRSLVSQPKIIVNTGDYNHSIKIKSNFLKKLIPDMVIGNFTQIKK